MSRTSAISTRCCAAQARRLGRAVATAVAVPALMRTCPLLRPDRAGDDRALDDQRRGVGHAIGEQGVAHELDQERADQRADHARLAAGERRAADRDRGDRVELHAEADEIGVARRIDRHDDEAGDAGAEAADRVDPALDRCDRHAGQPRRPLVAADRQDLAAEQGRAAASRRRPRPAPA